jgi:hypothetical protein
MNFIFSSLRAERVISGLPLAVARGYSDYALSELLKLHIIMKLFNAINWTRMK